MASYLVLYSRLQSILDSEIKLKNIKQYVISVCIFSSYNFIVAILHLIQNVITNHYIVSYTVYNCQANEMLLTERQITAQEASDGGLITRIFTEDRFREEVDKVVKHMAALPPQARNICVT